MKAVFKAIRTILLTIIISLILTFVAGWGLSIASCEYLTLRYGYQFEEWYKESDILGKELIRLKILAYYDDHAEVYYVTSTKEFGTEIGDVVSFRKENGEWICDGYPDTIWSKHGGNADGYIWPYGR